MRLGLLGQTRVTADDGTVLPVAAPKQRVVLAVLLLRRGAVVPQAELIEAVWGEEPPPNAAAALRTYVARLRRALGGVGERLSGGATGYRMEIRDAAEFDVAQAEALLASARVDVGGGRWAEAATLLERAEGLWRGAALADVPSEVVRQRDLPALEELRCQVVEGRLEAELRRGGAAEVVGRLRALVAEHPLRERAHAQLMRALHQTGRRDEALAAYRDARDVLREELGVDPSAELRELHRRVLADEPTSVPAPAADATGSAAAVPRELPPDVDGFAGRAAQLAALDALLRESAGRSAPTIVVLDGPAGAGKTALAVHWAHRVAGRFPDGQLHVDLQGFSPTPPTDPAAALGRVLRSLGVPHGQMPEPVAERTALLRSTTAGRRMVFLLDNARDVAQVRPLLAGAGCLVIVTSRNQLRGLVARDGARRVTLDQVDVEEARDLLAHATGCLPNTFDAASVARLLDLCSGLPLALRIVAERLARDGTELPEALAEVLAEVLADLADVECRLDVLAAGDDELSDMRAVLSWSVRALDGPAARALRLLGTQPGPEFTLPAAAALLGDPAAVPSVLDRLVSAHLVERFLPGRYRMHDLLRAYARELSAGHPEDDVARRRQLDWYLVTARNAVDRTYPANSGRRLSWPKSPVPGLEFADRAAASAWFDLVLPALVAAPEAAAGLGLDDHAWKFAWALWDHLDNRSLYDEFLAMHLTGLAAARRAGARLGEGLIRGGLRDRYADLGRFDEAVEHARAVLAIAEQTGDRHSVGVAYYGIGITHARQGDHEGALAAYQHGLDLATADGETQTQLAMLNNMGIVLTESGRPADAVASLERARTLAEASEGKRSLDSVLINLGMAHAALGEHVAALDLLDDALEMTRELGFPQREAIALKAVGETLAAMGDRSGAAERLRACLRLFDQVGAPTAADAVEAATLLASL